MGGTLGVLIAGGRGERLGAGTPKALVEVAGRTLLDRALAALAPLCDRVIVAVPADFPWAVSAGRTNDMDALEATPAIEAVAGGRSPAAFEIAHDAPGSAGPLAGLCGALALVAAEAADTTGYVAASATGATRRTIVLGVDLPLVTAAALGVLVAEFDLRLAAHAGGDGASRGAPPFALLGAPGGVPQPLAAIYTRAVLDLMRSAFERGERSMAASALALGAIVLDDAALERLGIREALAFNLNTPHDLAEAQTRLAAARESGP